METVEEFLAYAIRLESEAADRFGQLANVMQTSGNAGVAKLFRQLSDYSRIHLAEAQARSGFRDIPKLSPTDFVWPDLESLRRLTKDYRRFEPRMTPEERGRRLEQWRKAVRAVIAFYKE